MRQRAAAMLSPKASAPETPEGEVEGVPPLTWGEEPPVGEVVVLAAEKSKGAGVGGGSPIAIANRGDVIPRNLVRYAPPSTLHPKTSKP